MSKTTDNYRFNLPGEDDFVSINDINANVTAIDAELKILANSALGAAQKEDIEDVKASVGGVSGKIGETGNTGGSAAGGTVFAKLNAVLSHLMNNLSAARAAAIDTINTNAANASARAENAQNYTATNNSGSKTGILSQKASYTISMLENNTYGLNAIKGVINTINTNAAKSGIKSVQRGLFNSEKNSDVSENNIYYFDISVAPVNINKTMLIANASTDKVTCNARIVNSNTIRLYYAAHGYTVFKNINWQLIEFN